MLTDGSIKLLKELAKQLGAGLLAVLVVFGIMWKYHEQDIKTVEGTQIEMQIHDLDMDAYWLKQKQATLAAEGKNDPDTDTRLMETLRTRGFAEQRLQQVRE